jgi:RNA-directed DNA polymerase
MEKEIQYLNNGQLRAFAQCRNMISLSQALKVEQSTIIKCLHKPIYQQFSIPKKKGGTRTILSPEPDLHLLQSKIAHYLNYFYNSHVPISVHGFIRSDCNLTRNIITNASPHLKKKQLLNLDLADFFPSISADMVKKSLMTFPGLQLREEMACIISLLATHEWHLPAGSPLSPIISNIVFYNTDLKLESLARLHHLTYTRYADDLSFSSDGPLNEAIISEIKKAVTDNKFSFNEKKERLQTRFVAQWVTGIKVNENPNLDRKKVRLLRSILHHWKCNGLDAAEKRYWEKFPKKGFHGPETFIASLSGKINHVKLVRTAVDENDVVSGNLSLQLKTLMEAEYAK